MRTWSKFDDRAARLAAVLADAGVGPDDKVAFFLYNGPEYLEATFGCFKVRAVPVNVNYRYTESELHYLLDNSDAVAVDRVVPTSSTASTRCWTTCPTSGWSWRSATGRLGAPFGRVRGCAGGGRPGDADRAIGRRPVVPLHRRHHRHAEGRDVAPSQPARHRRADLPGRQGRDARDAGRASVRPARGARSTRARLPRLLAAAPLMHGTSAIASLGALTAGGAVVTVALEEPRRRRAAAVPWPRTGSRTLTIVGDAFAKPIVAALEAGPRNAASRTTCRRCG